MLDTTGSLAYCRCGYPFRYRGYYYDDETGLYYLNQRYYNPEWGRFINADDLLGSVGGLLSHNVFAYCGNNPVIMKDPSGNRRVSSVNPNRHTPTWYKPEKEYVPVPTPPPAPPTRDIVEHIQDNLKEGMHDYFDDWIINEDSGLGTITIDVSYLLIDGDYIYDNVLVPRSRAQLVGDIALFLLMRKVPGNVAKYIKWVAAADGARSQIWPNDSSKFSYCYDYYTVYDCNFVYNNGQSAGITQQYLENSDGQIDQLNGWINNWSY